MFVFSLGGKLGANCYSETDYARLLIGGGIANKEVSWAVYAERNDLYLQKNPDQRNTEVEKRGDQKGKYLMPTLYGAGEDKAIFGNKPAPVKHVEMNMKK
ncbi:MAG: hypothetical protein ACJ76F_05265 [Bacteroidia bacterium]